jgi:hypothetical protein
MTINRRCPNIGVDELKREKCLSLRGMERKPNILAHTAMVTMMRGRFITLKIQAAKDLLQNSGARVAEAVVPQLYLRRRRRREGLLERHAQRIQAALCITSEIHRFGS